MPSRCISLATCVISSRLGVMSPLKPDQCPRRAIFAAVGEDLLARAHYAQVDDLEVITRQHDADDVLADVVIRRP